MRRGIVASRERAADRAQRLRALVLRRRTPKVELLAAEVRAEQAEEGHRSRARA